MAFTFQLDIVSANGGIYSGKAEMAIVPTTSGEVGILAYHAPLLSQLSSGLVRVFEPKGKEEFFFVSSGFLEVQAHTVTVLADTVLRSQELDRKAAEKAQKTAQKALEELGAGEDYADLKKEIQLNAALLRAIDQIKRETGKR